MASVRPVKSTYSVTSRTTGRLTGIVGGSAGAACGTAREQPEATPASSRERPTNRAGIMEQSRLEDPGGTVNLPPDQGGDLPRRPCKARAGIDQEQRVRREDEAMRDAPDGRIRA